MIIWQAQLIFWKPCRRVLHNGDINQTLQNPSAINGPKGTRADPSNDRPVMSAAIRIIINALPDAISRTNGKANAPSQAPVAARSLASPIPMPSIPRDCLHQVLIPQIKPYPMKAPQRLSRGVTVSLRINGKTSPTQSKG